MHHRNSSATCWTVQQRALLAAAHPLSSDWLMADRPSGSFWTPNLMLLLLLNDARAALSIVFSIFISAASTNIRDNRVWGNKGLFTLSSRVQKVSERQEETQPVGVRHRSDSCPVEMHHLPLYFVSQRACDPVVFTDLFFIAVAASAAPVIHYVTARTHTGAGSWELGDCMFNKIKKKKKRETHSCGSLLTQDNDGLCLYQ